MIFCSLVHLVKHTWATIPETHCCLSIAVAIQLVLAAARKNIFWNTKACHILYTSLSFSFFLSFPLFHFFISFRKQ